MVKRITPEEVVEAYKATGLKPRQGDWFPERGCACEIGVMFYKTMDTKAQKNHFYDIPKDPYDVMEDVYGLSHNYVAGFTRGFDGTHTDASDVTSNDELAIGVNDGRAAYAACVKAGLVDGESA